MNICKLLINTNIAITLMSVGQVAFANDNKLSNIYLDKYDETIDHYFCYPYSCESEKRNYSKDEDRYKYLGKPLKYSLELLKTYTTTTDSHCKVLNQNPQPNETATWNGNCINGFASGKGTLQWYENGKKTDVVIANFHNGKKTGKGKYIYANGDIYEGDYLNGKKQIKGKYTWLNGSFYIGRYKDSKANGYGKLTLVKSDKNTIVEYSQKGKGHWQGDVYIVQGIFKDNALVLECNSEIDCQQKQANQK